MTTRYRVEYALKAHRRDAFIEFIKGLLAVPFVLHAQPTAIRGDVSLKDMALKAHDRYVEVMRDVEGLISDHIKHQNSGKIDRSKLKFLVPTIGTFFTELMLEKAFLEQDKRRAISSRRFVAPSFNDIRLILNTAQVMSLVKEGPLKLVTFDGDVTLYDDGMCLDPDSPVVPLLMSLLRRGLYIGIVTAAGYTEAARYRERLYGLLEAIKESKDLTEEQKTNLIVVGGESNFMFQSKPDSEHGLEWVQRSKWQLEEMKAWAEEDIQDLLDIAEMALRESIQSMNLQADLIRKERAVGIVPKPGTKMLREQLEEAVLIAQKTIEYCKVSKKIPFCAFNGGNDVFVDIGDKRIGVVCCQNYFGGIKGSETLHVGDQFLSAGHNDFKARMAAACTWVASPAETVNTLNELFDYLDNGIPT